MKLKVIYILIMFSSYCCSQSTLIVTAKECKFEERTSYYGNEPWVYLSKLKFYKDGELYRKFKPRHAYTDTLPDMEIGGYRVDYTTLFKKGESKFFTIPDTGLYTLDLCTDYVDIANDPWKPFISRIGSGESYNIFLSSQGCYHSRRENIVISRKDDDYFFTYNDTIRQLTEDQIERIKEFEVELSHADWKNGCTTSFYCTLTYKDEKLSGMDRACVWGGERKLKFILGLL